MKRFFLSYEMDIQKFVLAYKNYAEVLLNVLRGKKSRAVLRDGRIVYLSPPALKSLSAYYRETGVYPQEIEDCEEECGTPYECFVVCFLKYHGWKTLGLLMYKDNVKFIKYYKGKLAVDLVVHEVFDTDMYNEELRGDVLDVGANIGDSAIFFALRGAKRVLGVEPLPSVHEVALENVRLNRLTDRARILNAVISYGSTVVQIQDHDVVGSAGLYVKPKESGIQVKSVTVADLVKELDNPYLLKVDCEGCEYDILSHEKESLKCFEKVIMEYHGKPPTLEGFELRRRRGRVLTFYRK